MAPTTTIPWIAFVPDINGVCSSVGTFEITSNPRKIASTRIVSSKTSSVLWLMACPPEPIARSVERRPPNQSPYPHPGWGYCPAALAADDTGARRTCLCRERDDFVPIRPQPVVRVRRPPFAPLPLQQAQAGTSSFRVTQAPAVISSSKSSASSPSGARCWSSALTFRA